MPKDVLTPGAFDARFADKNEAASAINKLRDKEKVAAHLDYFSNGNYTFLTSKDLLKKAKPLSDFKILYSSFVNKAKIENGQYSEIAEIEKLNNPYVEHFAIEQNGKIIASAMNVIHGDMIYAADFVIHPDYREKGLAQALMVKSFDEINKKYQDLSGVWFIAGGHGSQGIGHHLYNDIFPSISLKDNLNKQNEFGFYIKFGAPGQQLLKSANRDLNTQKSLDDDHYIQEALQTLSHSQQPNLAAPQPQVVRQESKSTSSENKFWQYGKYIGIGVTAVGIGLFAYRYCKGNNVADINMIKPKL